MPKWRYIILSVAVLMSLSVGRAVAQESVAQPRCPITHQDRSLLLSDQRPRATSDRRVPYGIEPERTTLSPLYHLTSGALWFWENLVAADVASPGGYATTNVDYFKRLVAEYGPIEAFIYGIDRAMRNTKIGRYTLPKNERGLVEDDVARYRPMSHAVEGGGHKQPNEQKR